MDDWTRCGKQAFDAMLRQSRGPSFNKADNHDSYVSLLICPKCNEGRMIEVAEFDGAVRYQMKSCAICGNVVHDPDCSVPLHDGQRLSSSGTCLPEPGRKRFADADGEQTGFVAMSPAEALFALRLYETRLDGVRLMERSAIAERFQVSEITLVRHMTRARRRLGEAWRLVAPAPTIQQLLRDASALRHQFVDRRARVDAIQDALDGDEDSSCEENAHVRVERVSGAPMGEAGRLAWCLLALLAEIEASGAPVQEAVIAWLCVGDLGDGFMPNREPAG